MKKQESQRGHSNITDANTDLWTHGLICAFEFDRGHKKVLSAPQFVNHVAKKQVSSPELNNSFHSRENRSNSCECKDDQEDNNHSPDSHSGHLRGKEGLPRNCWVPIGWDRISELVQTVQVDACWEQPTDFKDDNDDVAVADVAAPYWERPVGPTWWCHVAAGHPYINSWLSTAQWLHPAVSIALRDESKLISERMKHILYEVPVRVACGLLFELLGQSAGDPLVNEDDIPIVLRSWQAHNFLVTSNCLLLRALTCRNSHEIIAHLACRLACWDDRLYRKSIFGAADEVELKFMDRRTHEDMYLFSIILNQEIQRLSTQVIRVKWTLHARGEIVFELLQHLRGDAAKSLLEGVRKSTREMIQEQEAVRDRLFTIQDVMQSTVRAWLQDKSLRVTHNLGVLGGCGLVLSIITGLFGINVDGIPGNEGYPYAFALFSAVLVLLGVILIGIGLVYLGLKQPIVEEDVEVRKLELQELVKMFQKEAESHAQVQKTVPRTNPTAAGRPPESAARNALIS
ncbi:uncharacterized protein Pyn_39949 [Prunus yedoensis var. nudiflora]|uniref:Magnesium transporter CorA-like family protein n=1 Tax=Prunus yedoensis var. nudiflora TaxID=2094558 RepID=A0A314UI46_PRUYE|nr:uncharacterized protein Pyn_39949 [Prunus yedoensis var. nudiflora]